MTPARERESGTPAMQDVALIRYQVLAANRRHFSSLFFAVVAFSWCFALSVWLSVRWTYPIASGAAFLAAGAILSAGAFIAQRLFRRERSSFEAMRACWHAISDAQPSGAGKPSRPGAMAIVVAAQSATGATLLAVGVALSWI